MTDPLTLVQAARIMREATRDKSYRTMGLGPEIEGYLRVKQIRLTAASFRSYESVLDKLARHFPDKKLAELEPPVGTELMEEFLDAQWGGSGAQTYKKAVSITHKFFEFCILRGKLHGDPTLAIERPKTRSVHREIFSEDQCRAIIAQANRRDRLCLRLLLYYGLRKDALCSVRFNHFDHQRRRLTIFTKGERIQEMPIVDPHFWMDLERHILDVGAGAQDYLLPGFSEGCKPHEEPSQKRSGHKTHDWWYERLEAASVVSAGQRRGERMHKARHTAIQRFYEATKDIKLTQQFAGHASMLTTADVYLGSGAGELSDALVKVML